MLIELHVKMEFEGAPLRDFLIELFKYYNSEGFSIKVESDINQLYKQYNSESNKTKNERELEERRLRQMVQINYYKMLFLGIINLNIKTDHELYGELTPVSEEINIYYESFISLLFINLWSYAPNPVITVYITCFCLRLDAINTLLLEFVKNITYNDYEKLSEEINKYFGTYAVEITTYIANHANIYNIVSLF
jgi:hypothetical protein